MEMGKSHSKIKAEPPAEIKNMVKADDPYETLNEDNVLDNLQDNFKKLELAFKYFLDLKEPGEIVQSKRALKCFKFMAAFCLQDDFRESKVQFELISKYNMVEVFSGLIKHCHPFVKEFVAEYVLIKDLATKSDPNIKTLKMKYSFASYLSRILCTLTECSKTFRYKYHEHKGSAHLLSYLSDEELIHNCLRLKMNFTTPERSANESSTGIVFLRSLIACCHNLSKTSDTKLSEWNSLNATSVLLKFAQITESYSSIRLYAYLALTNVVSDKDIETLPETITVMRDIIKLIKIGSNSIASKKELKRVKIDMDNDDSTDSEAAIIIFGLSQYNIIELLEALYRLSINDKTKPLIYQTFEMNVILKVIIIEGNNLEKEYALKLLYQLCFDASVRDKVFSEDKQLVNYLVDFNKKQYTKEDRISKKMVKGILWLKKQYFKEPDNSERHKKSGDISALNQFIRGLKLPELNGDELAVEKEEKEEESVGKSKATSDSHTDLQQIGHIMISYNKECRELCLKIKKELENDGHRIWIDVEDISGSSLEAMAKAVENSICVLVCKKIFFFIKFGTSVLSFICVSFHSCNLYHRFV